MESDGEEALSRNFGSDNVTPVCAPIMAAINAANRGRLPPTAPTSITERLQRAASAQVFETDVPIYPVATGTAANALALAQLAPPYGGVYCHDGAHIVTDECGAAEFFTGGAKLLGLPSPNGKIAAGTDRGGDRLGERHGGASRASRRPSA